MPWSLFIPVVALAMLVLAIDIVFVMRDQPSTRWFGTVAVLGVVAFPTAIVLHNALSALIGGEEVVSFIVAILVAPAAVLAGTLGVAARLWAYASARGAALAFAASAGGLALFFLDSLFALAITTATGANPPYQAAIEAFALPTSASALVAGALYVAVWLRRGPRPASP